LDVGGRFYQNLQKGWVPPLRWQRRPHPRAVLAMTTSPLNERMATSICGVGLSQRDHAIAATDHGRGESIIFCLQVRTTHSNSATPMWLPIAHQDTTVTGGDTLAGCIGVHSHCSLVLALLALFLRLQVPEHVVSKRLRGPGSRSGWTVRFESSTPAGESNVPMISTASRAHRARV
jgi:hypothetical protein